MHGLTNLKICVAKQAKLIFQYKKIKIKLYKTNAAIWFNKTCRKRRLILQSLYKNCVSSWN